MYGKDKYNYVFEALTKFSEEIASLFGSLKGETVHETEIKSQIRDLIKFETTIAEACVPLFDVKKVQFAFLSPIENEQERG